MGKLTSEGIEVFYHHYPRVAIVVTTYAKGKNNAMTAAWHAPISFSPPLYGVSISSKRFSYEFIADSKEFGINFLPFEATELVASIGGSSGSEIDKFQELSIASDKSIKTAVPILTSAYAAYECRLIDNRDYGDHRWMVGEIVAVHILEESFAADGTLNLENVSPILCLGQDLYLTTSKDVVLHLDREVYGKR